VIWNLSIRIVTSCWTVCAALQVERCGLFLNRTQSTSWRCTKVSRSLTPWQHACRRTDVSIYSQPWSSEGFYPGDAIVDFSRGSQNCFARRGKSGDIWFYPLGIKKTSFFTKNLVKTFKFRNPLGLFPLALHFPMPMLATYIRTCLTLRTMACRVEPHCEWQVFWKKIKSTI